MLFTAQRKYRIDLLTHLGVEKGRWKAVVWLVTHLLDELWKPKDGGSTRLPGQLPDSRSLQEMTEKALYLPSLDQGETDDRPKTSGFRSFTDITSESEPIHRQLMSRTEHELLGQVWRSLGNMIVADAAQKITDHGSIAPQILEIIALLHHRGIMPHSIYSYNHPADDGIALRQPPTLNLLSSHILTALSDAAWRAHETLVVEEYEAKGGERKGLRPEIPGSRYKVRVPGVGPEVWLELVLWSCIHGGWLDDGASILEDIVMKAETSWSVVSWREIVPTTTPAGLETAVNWNEVRYLMGTTSRSSEFSDRAEHVKVTRSVSSEVVTAYVDALMNVFRVGVGTRGVSPGLVLRRLTNLKSLLERNNLSLGTTTWDAIILRFLESGAIDVEAAPGVALTLAFLTAGFGQELSSENSPARDQQSQHLPQYMLDGTAASLGLMHRVLQAYVKAGSTATALRTMRVLQKKTDDDKQRAIRSFFKGMQKAADAAGGHKLGEFESPYAGVDYPKFDMQLPVTALASLLDLLAETQALDDARSLLHTQDLDGPLIPESLYSDPAIAPALVRFASAANDKELLLKVINSQSQLNKQTGERVPEPVLLAFLESQIEVKKWKAVESIMDVINDTPGFYFTVQTVALLARTMLRQAGDLKTLGSRARPNKDLAFVASLLNRIIKGPYETSVPTKSTVYALVTALSSIDERWAVVCQDLLPSGNPNLKLFAAPFNTLLEGVVDVYGGQKGAELLSKFWRPARADSFVSESVSQESLGGVPRMPKRRPDGDFSPYQYHHLKWRDGSTRRLQIHFRPNVSSVMIILRKVLQRGASKHGDGSEGDDASPFARSTAARRGTRPVLGPGALSIEQQDILRWAIRVLWSLGLQNRHIIRELSRDVSPAAIKIALVAEQAAFQGFYDELDNAESSDVDGEEFFEERDSAESPEPNEE